MNLFDIQANVTITCHKRITPFLEREVRELAFEIEEVFVTGIKLKATLNECIRLNLNLRCASQVLYSIKKFSAENADEVYREIAGIEWETIIPDPGYISITSNVSNPTINNSMFANLRVKDAIIDRLRIKRGTRPSSGSDLVGTVIHLFWKNGDAEIFIDTSGDSLARHGYRKIPGLAPMLESLASATIYATKWDRQSPFINPMCGSGTVAIEAAMIASNRSPGLFRNNFAFMHVMGYDEKVYLQEDAKLENQIIGIPGLRIIATDNDPRAVENARKNAVAAGVASMIEFSVCDFKETEIPDPPGVFFVNPEYGARLGDIKELEKKYSEIGDFMKKECGGYFGYIFTGNLDLAKKIGLKASRRIEFYTSTIDCRLLEYELYAGTRKKEE